MLPPTGCRARRPPAADRAGPLRGAVRPPADPRPARRGRAARAAAGRGRRPPPWASGARERWDTDTAGELIVLLAAMAELKARRLLGEAERGGARPRHARGPRAPGRPPGGLRPLPARRRLARRALRDSAGPALPARPARGRRRRRRRRGAARPPARGDRRRCSPRRRRRRSPTSPAAG